eukprot:CAMPEP_0171108140 /NCGR_PEP_ID=MMETSP0766_2-20121228/68240_1 /TAXON_ID=439317 /ORGANISM="Gambierdiscus australes, Strain CAWD 149" /LENGTH=122 /DNA_ID=CAMNT_0011569581 /DNA_START=36 /DNA_END=404 /DNA_ORIENTATION=+
MGAQESFLSLLQTDAATGPSPWSRPPSAPPFFGPFVAGVSALGPPMPRFSPVPQPAGPGSEVLVGAPPQISLRPDLMGEPAMPGPTFSSAEPAGSWSRHLGGLGPQLGMSQHSRNGEEVAEI